MKCTEWKAAEREERRKVIEDLTNRSWGRTERNVVSLPLYANPADATRSDEAQRDALSVKTNAVMRQCRITPHTLNKIHFNNMFNLVLRLLTRSFCLLLWHIDFVTTFERVAPAWTQTPVNRWDAFYLETNDWNISQPNSISHFYTQGFMTSTRWQPEFGPWKMKCGMEVECLWGRVWVHLRAAVCAYVVAANCEFALDFR